MREHLVVSYLRTHVMDFFDPWKDQVAIAGGAIRDLWRNEEPKDYDIFCSKTAKTSEMLSHIKEDSRAKLINNTGYLIEFDLDGGAGPHRVQLITGDRYNLDKAQPARDFDFISCCAQLYGEDLWFHAAFPRCVEDKRLEINTITSPVGTLMRLQRFVERGWKMKHEDASLLYDDMRAFSGVSQKWHSGEPKA